MRVVNDKQEKIEPNELDVLAVVTHSILSAFGIFSVIFAPLPMIVAAVRLPEPWSKVAAILGAVLALLFLNVQPAIVVTTFVFGVFVADGVRREIKFWLMLGQAASVATLVCFVALLSCAQWEGSTPLQFWFSLCDYFLSQLQTAITLKDPSNWELLRSTLVHEGPFIILSSVLLSFWLSIGFAAHLGLTENNVIYSAKGLREVRIPLWSSAIFLVLFLVVNTAPLTGYHWVFGLYRLVATLMFIAGCIAVSEVMVRRELQNRWRTIIYSSLVGLGFPIMVGIGVLSPWLFKRSIRLNQRLEEVI